MRTIERRREPLAGRPGTQAVCFLTSVSPGDVNAGAGWREADVRAWLEANEFAADALELAGRSWRAVQFRAEACAAGSLESVTDGLPRGIAMVRARARGDRAADEIDRRDTLAAAARLEVRAEAGRPPRLIGYAAVYGQPTTLWPGYREIIAPGAASRALAERQDVRGLFNHDPGRPLARSTISEGPGSLRLWEDDYGLGFELEPIDTADGETVVKAASAGVIDGASFAFHAREEREEPGPGYVTRTVTDFDLVDVSPVTYPQYDGAGVVLRGLRELAPIAGGRELVAALRGAGLTDAAISRTLADATAEVQTAQPGRTPRRDRLARSLRERTIEALDN